jgi:hypothetical protein
VEPPANPYQSPRLNDNKPHQAAALDTPSISWRRGIAAAMVAGLVAANTWMVVMTAIVLITETSPRELSVLSAGSTAGPGKLHARDTARHGASDVAIRRPYDVGFLHDGDDGVRPT